MHHRYQQHRWKIFATSTSGVIDTSGKFAGVYDTSRKFATKVNNTGGKLPPASTTPMVNLPPVSLTPVANNGNNISELEGMKLST